MDKLEKFLKRLSAKDAVRVRDTIAMLYNASDSHLDIKKLSGFDELYRVRIQDVRIIFRKTPDEVTILEVNRRSEKTYKKF